MGCSCCGGKIRRLAKQYQYMTVQPQTPESIAEKKARLALLQKFSTVVEEVDSPDTEKFTDDSTIHTD